MKYIKGNLYWRPFFFFSIIDTFYMTDHFIFMLSCIEDILTKFSLKIIISL